jgi:thiamine kinase-like enzyme
MGVLGISERIDEDRLQTISNQILQAEDGLITNWCCDAIGSANRNFVTDGVYRISGMTDIGEGVIRSWTLVLKVVIADPKRDDPAHYNYWRREIMTYQSGLLHSLPANVIAPECFAIEEKDDESVWLWLEEITYEPRSWEWNDYAYAAEKLGEFQASYLLGNPLPELPWVNRQWMRSWIKECKNYRIMPYESIEELIISNKRLAAINDRFNLLERSINDWLITLERLPRTFAHQDFYELNILLNSDRLQKGRLAVIDWQFASISGIGEDLGRFIGLSFSRGHVPIDKFREYRELFLSSYIKGMRHAGWHGDEMLPRFGCLASFALRSVWEVPKLLQKLEQDADSPESLRLMLITEQQMEAATEAERLLINLK